MALDFYVKEDISNLFISEYLEYPNITQYYREDLDREQRKISNDQVFLEFLGHLANPGAIAVLLGDVGEGKSSLIQKLTVELHEFQGDQKYLPIIINIQHYNEILEKDNRDEAIEIFWEKVYNDIIRHLEIEHRIHVPSKTSRVSEHQSSEKGSLAVTLEAIIAKLKSVISITETKKESHASIRSLDALTQLQLAAKDLIDQEKIRMVIQFDNLDTFCYEHERYMLFPNGFKKLKTKISIVTRIYCSEI